MHTPKMRHRLGLPSLSPVSAISVVVLAVVVLAAACSGHRYSRASPPSSPATSSPRSVGSVLAVPAVREQLTSDTRSTVVHDNEVMALAPHSGRLFAATDQWMYSGPAAGQILVKSTQDAPWTVFERTQSLRVEAINSFPIQPDQGTGAGHSLLITEAIVHGRSEIQWLVDAATSFTSSFVLPRGADVRSFGAHESQGVWAVYAGVSPTGIVRGVWSPKSHTLVFGPAPELSAAPPGAPGLKTQKVTGFAECAGALFVSINTKLYRRNDGNLLPGVSRWQLVYAEPPVPR